MRRALVLVLLGLVATACQNRPNDEAIALTGGNPERGRAAIRAYGCGGCHTIPGVPGANGLVGPPLTGLALRSYLAGVLPNTADNLERWVMEPQQVVPGNAMPNMGVTAAQARDMAAYLYTLK